MSEREPVEEYPDNGPIDPWETSGPGRVQKQSAPTQTTQDGWILVPREPTREMIQAAHWALFRWRELSGDPQREASRDEKHAIRWRAMIDVCAASS